MSLCRCTDFLKFFLDLDRAEVNQYSSWNYEECGNISTIQKKHYSSGRSLILEFHSDSGAGNYTGFRGIFQFLDKSKCLKIIGMLLCLLYFSSVSPSFCFTHIFLLYISLTFFYILFHLFNAMTLDFFLLFCCGPYLP